MGKKDQIVDQKRLYTERMKLQNSVFNSLINTVSHIGTIYADFIQSEELRNSMKATGDKLMQCMDNLRELNELEDQLEAEEQEREDEQ